MGVEQAGSGQSLTLTPGMCSVMGVGRRTTDTEETIKMVELHRGTTKDKAMDVASQVAIRSALWVVGGCALMLLLTVLHAEVIPAVPALGFPTCFALVFTSALVKLAVAPDFLGRR